MMLTQAYLKETFTYHPDGYLIWNADRNNGLKLKGKRVGTLGSRGYYMLSHYSKKYSIHRLVFMMHHGYLPKMIDHINRDKTDNRIENLRPCTPSENSLNVEPKSEHTGVVWEGAGWRASLHRDGKKKHLGVFKDKAEAIEVRRLAVEAYNGN